jgi:hypothetical protein
VSTPVSEDRRDQGGVISAELLRSRRRRTSTSSLVHGAGGGAGDEQAGSGQSECSLQKLRMCDPLL